MQKYDSKKIEKKWQRYWEENQTFAAETNPSAGAQDKKEKFYGLIEFPYPSGAGLHVGHPRPFTAMDVISRKRRMQGYNVLFPIGFDAFGLPTENYAIKTGRPPREVTEENIANFTRQLKSLGFSFDWSRAVDTTDPAYFKWTQWIFLKLYEHGLAYKKNQPINWCLSCKIGLANEEVVDGKCERCGGPVEKRDKEQWMLAITKYADSLLDGLNDVDYIERAKVQQENWIGRKEGINIEYAIDGMDERVVCFTTRPDTNFGATFVVIGPEHPLVSTITTKEHKKDMDAYVAEAAKKKDFDRTAEDREKTGVFTGAHCVNNLTGKKMPIWVADYVLGHVGTGAVVGVPGHDKRDFEFASTFDLPIVRVVVASDGDESDVTDIAQVQEHEGTMINSDFLDGMDIHAATEKVMDHLEEKGWGKRVVNYKLRDWVFSRQRYWGEPIPLVYCDACAAKPEGKGEEQNPGWIPLSEDQLPLELPHVEKYEPTDTGESPLAAMEEWAKTECPRCGGSARRETDTMPNWAGSSWYFLRYCDPKNDKAFASKESLDYWMSVDWYNGGMEHTVLHLLYSRFWNQFMFDIGLVPSREPYAKRTSHGLILAEGGEKMSKSKGNVVNPDDMIAQFSADALRCYIMFMGPFDQHVAWDTNGLSGVKRFLDRVWNLQEKVANGADDIKDSNEVLSALHRTIKKVGEDVDAMRFNTAIAKMMELTNEMTKADSVSKEALQSFAKILSPFAPHLAEEIWQALGGKESVAYEAWPTFEEKYLVDDTIEVVVQINGKVRATFSVPSDISEEDAKAEALEQENVQKWLEGNEPKKVIYVKGKLVSIVV